MVVGGVNTLCEYFKSFNEPTVLVARKEDLAISDSAVVLIDSVVSGLFDVSKPQSQC